MLVALLRVGGVCKGRGREENTRACNEGLLVCLFIWKVIGVKVSLHCCVLVLFCKGRGRWEDVRACEEGVQAGRKSLRV